MLQQPSHQDSARSSTRRGRGTATRAARPFSRAPLPGAAAISASVTQANGHGGGQNSAGSSKGSSTIAVMMRCFSMRLRRLLAALRACAELLGVCRSGVRGEEGGDRRVERGIVEVGPEAVGEKQLRIRQLPQQEIADPVLRRRCE